MEKLIEILMSDDIESAIRENEEFIFTIIPELRLEKNFDHKNKHHCYDNRNCRKRNHLSNEN